MVAEQQLDVAVVDHRQRAVRAGDGVSALAAGDGGGRAAPVEEENRLLADVERRTERLQQRAAEHAAVAKR
jgi:hypothetical protein